MRHRRARLVAAQSHWRGGVAAGGSPPLPARSTVVPAGQSESRQRRTAKLPRFVLADHHQRPLANVTPWYSWELMMKPVRIVILATMAFLASACAATSAGQPAGSGAPGVSPSGNRSEERRVGKEGR